ncbi:hypothetical protein K491DRAFT_674341 [Lophiostoma macrostomum CBS 122681]|uniref:Uncharacterized protein n=1 Tax=Lophiostoma macrostomum CBS 122681 TaxID=1314788 RepID=A0A6A6TLV8_9PLEO|nr:hypothetical protein K491DRAFT_674341 [Lophiostoma macrostomum CBS 122681]
MFPPVTNPKGRSTPTTTPNSSRTPSRRSTSATNASLSKTKPHVASKSLASALAELEEAKNTNKDLQAKVQILESQASARVALCDADQELLIRAEETRVMNQNLHDELKVKSDQLDEQRNAQDITQRLNRTLLEEIDEKDKGLEFLHQRCRDAEKKIVEQENGVTEAQKTAKKLSGEVHCLTGELDRVRKDRDELIDEVWQKEKEVEELNIALEKAQTDNEKSMTVRQVLNKELKNIDWELTQLRKDCESKNGVIKDLKKEATNAVDMAHEYVSSKAMDLQEERARLALQAQTLEADMEAKLEKKYAARIKELEDDVDAEKQVANICITENDRLMCEAAVQNREISALNEQILEQRDRARALDEQVEKKGENLARAQALNGRLLTQVQNIRESREEVEREAEAMQESNSVQIQVLRRDNENLRTQLQVARTQVAAGMPGKERTTHPMVSKHEAAKKEKKLEREKQKAVFQSLTRAFWY